MYGKIDSIEKALDYAIRDREMKECSIECGYIVQDKKEPYQNYMSNSSWTDFTRKMSQLHLAQYKDGDGDELYEKKGRYGWYPPKMASFGSSSRFIYRYSNDIKGFSFEKQLPTRVGGMANLDGYALIGKTDVFVEAKCREIYSSHKKIEISNVYKDIYDKLTIPNFSYKDCGVTDDEHFNCTFYFGEEPITHFDIKQLICHFLGISANILENPCANTNVKFIYLIFNPNFDTCFDNPNISLYKERILKAYNATILEINKFGDMKCFFDKIMEIQSKRLQIAMKDYSFEFRVADQTNYARMLSL